MDVLLHFAATETAEAANKGLLEALGLDLRLFILQLLAFLILVFLLGKFVYPHIIKALDDRRDTIEEGLKNAQKATEDLAAVEQKVADIIKSARAEATDIISLSQKEAANLIESAEVKASQRAEYIVSEAQAQISKEMRAAEEALKKETAQLVAAATEKIIGVKVDAQKDAALLEQALGKKGAA